MQARGYAREDCIAVGDSREDLDAAAVVGAFWLVANALERDPDAGGDDRRAAGRAGRLGGLRRRRLRGGRDDARHRPVNGGAGVYEAVVTTLATAGERWRRLATER